MNQLISFRLRQTDRHRYKLIYKESDCIQSGYNQFIHHSVSFKSRSNKYFIASTRRFSAISNTHDARIAESKKRSWAIRLGLFQPLSWWTWNLKIVVQMITDTREAGTYEYSRVRSASEFEIETPWQPLTISSINYRPKTSKSTQSSFISTCGRIHEKNLSASYWSKFVSAIKMTPLGALECA
jgi:hypothetical protein